MFNIFKKKEPSKEERSSLAEFAQLFGLGGNSVQGDGALKLVPVYTCIRYLADSIGMTTLSLYKKDKNDNRELSRTHPLNNLIQNPQSNMTTINWFQAMIGQYAGFGNAYAVISRNRDHTVKELIFVPSSNVSHQITTNGELAYHISLNNKSFTLYAEDMIHLKGWSLDGYTGISPIATHRQTLERSASESTFGKKYYDNASSVGGVVSHPSKLNKETIKELKEQIQQQYGGVDNSGKTMILTEGMKYDRIEMISPTDANYVASRNMSDKEIANIFRVPVILLNDTESATYANVENLNLYFQMYSLNPIYKTIEQEFNLKLISASNKNHYFEFNPESLLNSNSTQKTERLDKGIKGGFLTPNEARKQLNLNPLEGCDDVYIPLNYVPASKYEEVMIDDSTASTPVPKVAGQDDLTDETKANNQELEKRYNSLSSKMGRLEKTLKKISEK